MKFRKYDQAQTKFVNLDYRKILGEDSDPVMIDNIVNALDLSRMEEKYVEVGNPAYHPKMMVKVLIYGYYNGYFGGRPLHRNYETDLGLRFLSNDDFPDHRTINLFRINFKDEIAEIFSQVVMLCKELDMIGFENLAIDGQKIRANANFFQSKNLNGIQKEKEKIKKQLVKLLEEELSFLEGEEEYKANNRKKAKLERRKKKLEEAAQLLIDAGAENDEKMRLNLTDPDSRTMTDKLGVKLQDYNTQNAVDDKFQVLTAVDVTDNPSDSGELFPMKEKSRDESGGSHKHTLADSGYSDKVGFRKMEEDANTDYYVPDKTMYSSKKNPYSKWNFKYDEDRDVFVCPEGEDMVFVRECKDSEGLKYRHYKGTKCSECDKKEKCIRTKNRKRGGGNNDINRNLSFYPEDECIKRMRKKLRTDGGKKIHQKRMSTVEPVHGDIQKNRGFLQFVLRGLEKVKVEYNLVGIAHNVRKILLHAADALKKFVKGVGNTA